MARIQNANEPVTSARVQVRGIAVDIALSAGIPFVFYRLAKQYISPSELVDLAIATTFPLVKSVFGLLRRREADPVSLMVLGGIVVSGAAVLLGSGARVLLVRESIFTGLFGLACFVSLLFPRPLMFYFGRHFMAGKDPEKLARFEMSWSLPALRFAHRLITVVWGAVYLGECLLRVLLVYKLPPGEVLVISPILLGGLTIVTILWTFRYGRLLRQRAQEAFARMNNLSEA